MAFLPLLPPEEASNPPEPPTNVSVAHAELTPQNETPPEDDLHRREHDAEFMSSPPVQLHVSSHPSFVHIDAFVVLRQRYGHGERDAQR